MKKLKATWKLEDESQFEIPDDTRRSLLRATLKELDADWGLVRSDEAMEGQLDYLMGLREEPYPTTENDWNHG